MSRFLTETLSQLTPYTPGEQPQGMQFIKLNTNESPYLPSMKAVEYAAEAARRLNLYPDPSCSELTRVLAKRLGVGEDEIILGNGSDEILFFAFSAFCDQAKGALFPDISYGFYEVFASLCRVPFEKCPLKEDLSIDIRGYLGAKKTIFIANPNAPTGIVLPLDAIEAILRSNPDSVVVVDEAYIDFGGESAVPLIRYYDNLLVVQTFSKSRSMAGARLGMGIASKGLIQDLNTIKFSLNPYNVNRMTMAAALGTLAEDEYSKLCCKRIIETREYTAKRLEEMGFSCPKSSANFIFAMHPRLDGRELYLKLKQMGILVRHFDSPRIKAYNRITIGTREQMDALLDALKSILEATK